jgi:hypothetical protein
MSILGVGRKNTAVVDNEERRVKWIQERPNVWRVVYADGN